TQSTVLRAIASARASKSNIVPVIRDASSIAIGTIEIALDVETDGLLQRREAALIAGTLQAGDIALGEILMAVADRQGHVGIAQVLRQPQGGIGRKHEILEAAGLAGADVENTRDRWRRQEPHHHAHGIIDIDEIAPLIAIRDAFAVR